jgi:hypothetical protein
MTPFNTPITLVYVIFLYEKVEYKCDITKQSKCKKGYFKVFLLSSLSYPL